MASHEHRTQEHVPATEQRMRARIPFLRLAAAAPLAVALPLLAGCAAGPVVESGDASSAAQPVTESTAAPEGAGTEEEAVAAAVEAAEQRFERWAAGDHAGACELLSDAYAERIADNAGVDAEGCEAILAAVDEHNAGVVATAEADGVDILTPYYWLPQAIEVDASGAEADSTSLVFVPGRSITVTDDTAFRDGPAAVPGWLEESSYVQLIDGVWTFILPTER